MSHIKGLVFNIQHFSIHDGSGIRTTVFLKGCPLRCSWCANPESQATKPELSFIQNRCIDCGECEKCEQGAIRSKDENGQVRINVKNCENAEVYRYICPAQALTVMGEYKTVEEILEKVEEDSVFYRNSFGGMTLSGGEPLMQPDFSKALLEEAQKKYIDTSIETTGFSTYDHLYSVFSHLNSIIYDIKLFDDEKHKLYTGVSNELILKNFERMRQDFRDVPVLVRTPVIPGVNDNKEEIKKIRDFINQFPNVSYELLKFHRLGESKYKSLGRKWSIQEKELDKEIFEELKNVAYN